MNTSLILFITGNSGKFKDAQLVFGNNVTNASLDLDEIQSMDPKEVIKHKLHNINFDKIPKNIKYVMIEDTSLFINCLGGLPGPFVKFFIEKLGPNGIQQQVNMNKDHYATAVSWVGIKVNNNNDKTPSPHSSQSSKEYFFYSEVQGTIVPPRGTSGFGWDSIFQPNDSKETYAEMDSDTRSIFNMRIQAMKQFKMELEMK